MAFIARYIPKAIFSFSWQLFKKDPIPAGHREN
jgi:hypothetical protein